MRDFFETQKFKILLVVLFFLAGIMAYAGANDRLTAAPQEILSVVISPFQTAGAHVANTVSSLWNNITNFSDIIEENERLKQENAALRQQMVDYDILKAENEAYRDLQELQIQHPEYQYCSAFVNSRDSLAEFYSFTVNQGQNAGIQKGDTVVSDEGYLVGIVQEVSLTSCRVMTLLHPNFAAACLVSATRENGIVCGNSSYANDLYCTMTNLSRENTVAADSQVVTTGVGGHFPESVLVGTVVRVETESNGKSCYAIIKPLADVSTLTHVFVILSEE